MINNRLRKIFLITFVIGLLLSVFNIGKVLAAEPLFKLSNATIIDKSSGVEAAIENYSNNELITNTTFHEIGDYVKYNLTIQNSSNSKYKLVLVNDNNSSDNVTYEYEYDKDEEVAPKSDVDVVLKITYDNGVTDINKRIQDKDVKITFTLVDEEGNVVPADVIINPETGDNLWLYIIIAFISLTGILLLAFSKKVAKLFALVMLLVPVIVFASSPTLTIVLKNNTKLYDKVVINKVINGETQAILVDYNDTFEKPQDPEIPGYEFIGWYVGDEEYNFDKPLTEDMTLTAKLKLIQYTISYDLGGETDPGNPTKYNVETESFDLINPTKEGYVFAGWTGSNGSNLQTRVTIEKGSTGNKSFVAHFSINQNTPYKVNHKYRKLDGTFETEVEELTGPTGETVYPAVRSKTGFDNPEVKELTILANGNASIDYEYERKEYSLTIQDSEYVETTFTEDKYPYETEITLTAKNREHYDFVKWSNDSTNNPLTFKITENTTIKPVYQLKQYTVSFDTQGGVDVDDITKDYNTQIGNLPQTTKNDYLFDGWFTEASGGTQISTSTLVTGNVTYYAHWSKSMTLATVSPESVTVTRLQTQTITVSNVDEEYTFTSGDSDIATVDENGVVTGKKKGTTTITIEGTRSHEKKTVSVTVNPIMYNITFDAQGGSNGTTVSKEENTAIGTLPNSEKTDYLFDGWFTESSGGEQISASTLVTGTKTYYAHWSKSMTLATVSPESVTVTRLQTQTITVSNVDEEYTFTSGDSDIATVDENGVVTGKKKGTTTITIEGTRSHEKKTVSVTVNPIMYTVSFNSQGGGSFPNRSIEENTAVGALPTPEKEGYNFVGWYTEDGNTKVSADTVITETTTFVAHWDKIICKKAQAGTLHIETCSQSSNTGCRTAGYAQGATITYGKIPTDNSPLPGDAYDCDVNDDGTFDPATERFYFVRKNDSDEIARAVLVHYTSFDENGQADSSTSRKIYLYDDGKDWLPNSTVWSNPGLTEIDGKVSRYVEQEDLIAACGAWNTNNGYLDSCQYFMENSRFQSDTLGRSGIWMEKINNTNYRIDTRTRKVSTVANDSSNSVRPVIEFKYTMIEGYSERTKYTVTFDTRGGSSIDSITRYENQEVGTLP